MNTKSIKMRLVALLFLIAASIMAVSLKDAGAMQILPHEQSGAQFTLGYSDGTLELKTDITAPPGGGIYQFQYWLLTKVDTDNSDDSLQQQQFIWQMVRPFDSDPEFGVEGITVNSEYIDTSGMFNAMVRIRQQGGAVMDEIFAQQHYADLGLCAIKAVFIDGRQYTGQTVILQKGFDVGLTVECSSKPEDFTLTVYGNALTYASFVTSDDDLEGKFTGVEISQLPVGRHKLVAAVVDGAVSDILEIDIYITQDYPANTIPIINSFTGKLTDGTSEAVFTLKLSYADGTPIATAAAQQLKYIFYSGGVDYVTAVVPGMDGKLDKVTFTVNYGEGNYGIYQTTVKVSRSTVSGPDDTAILWFSDYARKTSTLSLKATAADYLEGTKTFSTSAKDPVSITLEAVNGLIPGADLQNIRYSFYREDASGWILLKQGMSHTDNKLTWTPVRPGKYNIQARITDTAAGTFEQWTTTEYTITGSSVSGNAGLLFYDLQAQAYTEKLVAGKAYRLEADYLSSGDALYRFIQNSANIGTVYLSRFTASPYHVFVPNRPGNFSLSVRIIDVDSYGYKDISSPAKPVYVYPSFEEKLAETLADGYLADFSDADYAQLVKPLRIADTGGYASPTVVAEYLAEYMGESNVLKVTSVSSSVEAQYWGRYTIKFPRAAEKSSITLKFMIGQLQSGGAQFGNGYNFKPMAVNSWHTVTLDYTDFAAKDLLQLNLWSVKNAENILYFAWVIDGTVEERLADNLAPGYLADFSDADYEMLVRSASSNGTVSLVSEYLTEHEGENNVLKVTSVSASSGQTFGNYVIKLPKAAEGSKITVKFMIGQMQSSGRHFGNPDTGGAGTAITPNIGVWQSMTLNYSSYTKKDELFLYLWEGAGATNVIYFAWVIDLDTIVESLEDSLEAGYLADFSHANYIHLVRPVTANPDANIQPPASLVSEYLEQYQGETGVLKVTSEYSSKGANYGTYIIKLPKAASGILTLKYMVGQASDGCKFGNPDGDYKSSSVITDINTTTNTWHTVTLDYTTYTNADDLVILSWGTAGSKNIMYFAWVME